MTNLIIPYERKIQSRPVQLQSFLNPFLYLSLSSFFYCLSRILYTLVLLAFCDTASPIDPILIPTSCRSEQSVYKPPT